MKNCTILDNDVYHGIIFGWTSVIHITDSIFENNIGTKGGTVCMIVHSIVIVSGFTFTNNRGLGTGGAVSVIEYSTLVISNSFFVNNTASLIGGGVLVTEYCRIDISKSIFEDNTASLNGGAVVVNGNSSLICTSSNFIKNSAKMFGAAISVHSSNATLLNLVITQSRGRGAFSFFNDHFINIHHCIFNKNTGGAIWVYATMSSVIWNCDFFANEAGAGGNIYIEFSESFTMSNVRFFQNVAEIGGVIAMVHSNVFIESCIFKDNKAYFDGGAVFIPSGNVSIQNSYFINNTAEQGFGGIVSIGLGTLFMSNCSVKHNYAGTGGVIHGNECQINLTHCIFENNTARVNGGAVYIRDNSPEDDGGDMNRRGSKLHILNSLFWGNSALTGSGGGAIYIFGDVLKIFHTIFSFNNARGAGIMELIDVREILLSGSTFVDNFSSVAGIINATSSTFVAINSMFNRNIAGDVARFGCLVFTYGKASLENCTLSNNINPGYMDSGKGGAITSVQCELRISTSLFDNNEAGLGKDIFLENDVLTYVTSFKHSLTYMSNDENFKDMVFQDNIFFSNHPSDITISESLYASGKNSF